MGRDPKRLVGLRADEHLVALALERVTGAVAHAHDVEGRQGAVDLTLDYPDGRTAAVEVTTHAGSDVRRRNALRRPGRPSWPDPRRPWWTVVGAERVGASALDALPAAVSHLLEVPSVARRAAKSVGAPGVDERHLVVEVGEGGVSESLYAALVVPGGALPAADPQVPEGLTHVWITTGWAGSPLIGWQGGHGWSAHVLGDGSSS